MIFQDILNKLGGFQEARRKIYEVINGLEYRIENTETMSAKRGSRTMVSYSGDIKIGFIKTDASLSDIKENQLASYQLFGFISLTEALYDQEIQTFIKPGPIRVNQRNIYTSMEKLQVEPYLEINDMKTFIYLLLLMLFTKKQSICQSPRCDAPYTLPYFLHKFGRKQ
ncbi:hypothetical protein [Amphibacillus cookii]|uniref:hypothetical protein n=1 Tax=Amphibacillus cookii TaxID=767787 RepID=UPI00195CF3C2|nr:hypothetical protein [Amphibacillus cookii]MBM7540731.1 hypothetical protein [Amphibacillus cookii]